MRIIPKRWPHGVVAGVETYFLISGIATDVISSEARNPAVFVPVPSTVVRLTLVYIRGGGPHAEYRGSGLSGWRSAVY